jgi:hypothetical protein
VPVKPPGLRARLRLNRARLRLRLARYWQADGDLDEAARHAHRALRFLHGSPVHLTGELTLTAAEVERDRCEYASSSARLTQSVDHLDRLPAASSRDRLLLARALSSLELPIPSRAMIEEVGTRYRRPIRSTGTGKSPLFASSYDFDRPILRMAPAVSTSMVAARRRTASIVHTVAESPRPDVLAVFVMVICVGWIG